MSMIARSFTSTPFRRTMQLARGGGHAEGYNQPTGYPFSEKALLPLVLNDILAGAKRLKEDWEPLFFYGFMDSMVLGSTVIYYKPDTEYG
ncbi:hypothetical protein BGZ81_001757 [Podila clonocystis]|nr:hypothetical protein BGZ81_001757 [Podila clonocystis]